LITISIAGRWYVSRRRVARLADLDAGKRH
jgi:hypothetical protein